MVDIYDMKTTKIPSYKNVLDEELPQLEVPQYKSCFSKIDQIVKEKLQKPMSTFTVK